MSHRFIPHTEADVRQMLDAIDVASIAALFESIPDKHRRDGPLDLPAAASEQEVSSEIARLAAKNASLETHDWFLGAGTYAHFVPSAVDALVSRAEFTTAYTPYQPEISQGTLQTIFEWQTMIASLTGVDVANASLYDGASATAEAALMALRITRRRKVVVSTGLHPHYLQVLETYLAGLDAQIETQPLDVSGITADATASIDADTACILVQQPNFLGSIEDLRPFAEAAHRAGALLVTTVTEALSLALLTAPGALGADIVCGEAQSFGVPMSFGGPHLGFLATRTARVRQMPGRLVGETVDAHTRRGYVLTLSTREQHIRRERATSNICTNQGLCLTMATIYLALMGRRGLRELAEHNLAKAEYARSRVRETPGVELAYSAPSFNEFCVRVPDTSERALERALDADCVGGLDLTGRVRDMDQTVLVCTTELTSREAIDRLVAALANQGVVR
ncbi:MAG: aminomethyl-transferring glycine dehydrogenase subunit GcvPA [Myxococcota bacterium]|nr:aminomethyl-transferring glycine dehydrogenase subunit GcvPA [Myxococcota bacterium]